MHGPEEYTDDVEAGIQAAEEILASYDDDDWYTWLGDQEDES